VKPGAVHGARDRRLALLARGHGRRCAPDRCRARAARRAAHHARVRPRLRAPAAPTLPHDPDLRSDANTVVNLYGTRTAATAIQGSSAPEPPRGRRRFAPEYTGFGNGVPPGSPFTASGFHDHRDGDWGAPLRARTVFPPRWRVRRPASRALGRAFGPFRARFRAGGRILRLRLSHSRSPAGGSHGHDNALASGSQPIPIDVRKRGSRPEFRRLSAISCLEMEPTGRLELPTGGLRNLLVLSPDVSNCRLTSISCVAPARPFSLKLPTSQEVSRN
jgi:hypothetical protein